MIALALAISTVALGGVACWLAKGWKESLDDNDLKQWELAHAKDKLARQADALERASSNWSSEMQQANLWSVRYHAALRALRTRQAVIDGMARERDFAVSNYGMIERVWKQRETDMNSDRAAAKAKALFYQTQAEEVAKQRDEWREAAENIKETCDRQHDRIDRLAAQLKKLKARSK